MMFAIFVSSPLCYWVCSWWSYFI